MGKAIQLGEEVTITLPVQQWDALLGDGDRHWADWGLHLWEGYPQTALFKELGLDLTNLRSRARSVVENATPGASSRRALVKGHMESLKPELTSEVLGDIRDLVTNCIERWRLPSRPTDWDHLGCGDAAPGGRCGLNDGISVSMTPGPPHLHISRAAPHFDRDPAWTFSSREQAALRKCVKEAVPIKERKSLIVDEWGGGEWISYKLALGKEA